MNEVTRRMIAAYFQNATPTMFLSGFFQSPAQNFHRTEKVTIDIQRFGEKIATAITDMKTGANLNSFDGFVNKEFTPPVFDEAYTLNAFDLMKREVGEIDFTDPNFQANAIVRAFRNFRELEAMIRRAVEQMSAQVLQTGTVTLRDKNGTAIYAIDYKPKSTHFATVGTSWATSTTKVADLTAACAPIRTDGLTQPARLIFGANAWQYWINDAQVQKLLDVRNMSIGQIAPEIRGEGGVFQGYFWLGNYRVEMWTYDGRYDHPQTGTSTPYVGDDKVIIMGASFRGDITYGAIPTIVPPDSRVLPFMPSAMNSPEAGIGLSTNAWVTADGKNLSVSAGTRPLVIPTAIDRFACLDVVP